jgi:hypothetical protein
MNPTQHVFSPPSDSLPIACSLDAAGMVDRRAEFNGLFGTSLVSWEREPLELRLELAVQQDAEPSVCDLFQRERECCPFFSFAFRRERDMLVVTIGVPEGADAALDAFSEMVTCAASMGPR